MKDPILGHTENNQESPKKNSQDSVKKIKLDKNENFQILITIIAAVVGVILAGIIFARSHSWEKHEQTVVHDTVYDEVHLSKTVMDKSSEMWTDTTFDMTDCDSVEIKIEKNQILIIRKSIK